MEKKQWWFKGYGGDFEKSGKEGCALAFFDPFPEENFLLQLKAILSRHLTLGLLLHRLDELGLLFV